MCRCSTLVAVLDEVGPRQAARRQRQPAQWVRDITWAIWLRLSERRLALCGVAAVQLGSTTLPLASRVHASR